MNFPILSDTLVADLNGYVASNKKINLIKLYRELFKTGLPEAKEAIDQCQRDGILQIELVLLTFQAANILGGTFNHLVHIPPQQITRNIVKNAILNGSGDLTTSEIVTAVSWALDITYDQAVGYISEL